MRLSVDQGLKGRISPKLESFGSLLLWLEEKGIYWKGFSKEAFAFHHIEVGRGLNGTGQLCCVSCCCIRTQITLKSWLYSLKNIWKCGIVELESIRRGLGEQIVRLSSTRPISQHSLQNSSFSFHSSTFPLASLHRARHARDARVLPRLRPRQLLRDDRWLQGCPVEIHGFLYVQLVLVFGGLDTGGEVGRALRVGNCCFAP